MGNTTLLSAVIDYKQRYMADYLIIFDALLYIKYVIK